MIRDGLGFGLGVAALVLVMTTAATLGPYPLGFGDIVRTLTGAAGIGAPVTDPRAATVLFDVRLPRIATAALVGAALAAAGTAYQTIFRNPLVSPDILGVSTGTGLGAALGILLSLPVYAIQGLGFLFGLGAVALTWGLASSVRSVDRILVLVLAGVVVGALAGAAISLVKILADPYDQLPAITFWLLGSLASVKRADLWPVAGATLIGLVPMFLLSWRIGVLSLGDDEARALGVDAGRLRALVVAAATLVTAGVVAVSGVIGWIGLMIPHMARMLVGPTFHRLLPVAMLMGAVFLVGVDTLARTLARIETPIGILTALTGAPFFLWLLARGRKGWS